MAEPKPSFSDASDPVARLERRLDRERRAREEAERLLEEKALELYTANRDLAERIHELEDERRRSIELARAKVAAERDSAAKSAFLAAISHELRTPLNGVIGLADLLAETSLTDQQRTTLHTLRSCGAGLVNSITDILDFTRIEAAGVDVLPAPVDPLALVEAATRSVHEAARARGLVLAVVADPALPARVTIDGDRVKQVLARLLSNAIKFTEAGHVCVRLMVPEAGRISIAVEDTGIGFSMLDRDNLFKPFRQLNAGFGRRHGGLGLGLSICRSIAEAMAGSLTADGAPGSGATFRLDIPAPGEGVRAPHEPQPIRNDIAAPGLKAVISETLASAGFVVTTDAEPAICEFDSGILALRSAGRVHPVNDILSPASLSAVHPAAPAPAAAVPVAAAVTQPSLDILVVEDNPVNQDVVCRMLNRLGHRTTVADDGARAINLLEHRSFDLVYMDLQMPGMDGFSTTREIRWRGLGGAAMPIVALTANTYLSDREAARRAGMTGFLAKPVDMAGLARSIDEALSCNGASLRVDTAADGTVDAEVPVLNEKRLAELGKAFGQNEVPTLIAMFLDEAAIILDGIDAARGVHDHAEHMILLHTLKGAAANVGFEEIQRLAATQYRAGRLPDAEGLAALRRALRNARNCALSLNLAVA